MIYLLYKNDLEDSSMKKAFAIIEIGSNNTKTHIYEMVKQYMTIPQP